LPENDIDSQLYNIFLPLPFPSVLNAWCCYKTVRNLSTAVMPGLMHKASSCGATAANREGTSLRVSFKRLKGSVIVYTVQDVPEVAC